MIYQNKISSGRNVPRQVRVPYQGKKSKPQRFSSQRQLNTSSGDSGTRQRLPLRGKLTLRGAGSAAWTRGAGAGAGEEE
jgi:hypothetical protein